MSEDQERREYRVRWQREGRPATSQIYQTEKGAVEKKERMERLDEEKKQDDGYGPDGRHFLHDMPDLVAPPSIEWRAVGEWEPRP